MKGKDVPIFSLSHAAVAAKMLDERKKRLSIRLSDISRSIPSHLGHVPRSQ
jgi:hypothetical protein